MPTTEAGKRLLAEDTIRIRPVLAVWCVEHGFASPEHLIDAIEDEARADALRDAAAAVEGLRKAAQDVIDGWDESLRFWLAAGEEEGDDGPAMEAIRDPAREVRRVTADAGLRAALGAIRALGEDGGTADAE